MVNSVHNRGHLKPEIIPIEILVINMVSLDVMVMMTAIFSNILVIWFTCTTVEDVDVRSYLSYSFEILVMESTKIQFYGDH